LTNDRITIDGISNEFQIHHICKNTHQDMGECEINPKYMLNNCRMSCGKCETIADDKIEDVSMMLSRTAKFGAIQSAAGNRQEITVNTVKSMLDYMEKSDDYLSLPSKIRNNCKNNVCDWD
jgi:hypothetical protein